MGFEGEGKKTQRKMSTPFKNMARSVTSLAARGPVHSLAHELAASPEATKGGSCRRSFAPCFTEIVMN